MKTSLLLKLTLIITAAFTMNATQVNASHIVGADLTYDCVGVDSFLVKLQLYRDCNGVPAPGSANISIASVSCGQGFNPILQLMNPGGTELSTLCPSMQINTTCNGGWLPGIEVYKYQGIVVMPAQCDDWVMSYSVCCRVSTINTVNQPAMYIEATLDNLNFTCNSSPLFLQHPIPYVCLNNNFCLNNSAWDVDGDSLIYAFTDPLTTGPLNPISWVPPYTTNQPIIGATIDNFYGAVCITPTVLGGFNMAVKIEEWDPVTVTLKSTIMRDMLVLVQNCAVTTNTIIGQVTDTTGAPVNASTVELYEYNVLPMTLVADTVVDALGNYAFPNMPLAQYVIQAHPDTNFFPGHVPTYHDSAYAWLFANVQYGQCDTIIADIKLRGIGNLNMIGWLNGNFSNSPQKTGNGAPMQGIDIFLLKQGSGELVAWAETDANGDYSMQGLPFGDYELYVDIAGTWMDSTHYFTLDINNQSETGLNFWTDSSWIYVSPPPPIGIAKEASIPNILNVYPNPYSGYTNVGLDIAEAADVKLEVFNILGERVHVLAEQSQMEGRFTYTFSAAELGLSTGIYILKLSAGDLVYTKRLIETK